MIGEWGGKCPLSYLAHPSVVLGGALWHAAQVAPLSGWPHEYVACVADGVQWFRDMSQGNK